MRNSFIFYRSFYEAIKDLPRDIQGEIYTAIMEYALYGKETENLKPVAHSIFTLIKPNLQANISRYENGKKGGRPPKKTEEKPNNNLTETEVKANKDKDKDKDKDDDKDYRKKVEPSSESVVKKESERIDYRHIVDTFNTELSPPLSKVISLSDARKRAIKVRVGEHGIESVYAVFTKVKESSFLRGENGHNWKCDFDWIFKPSNYLKILEGNYNNNEGTKTNVRNNERPRFDNYDEHEARQVGGVQSIEL